jgi:uncharacterized protein involved in type VI secretion and phage assembly
MRPLGAFANPLHWLASPRIGRVVSVEDPLALSRVQVSLPGLDSDGAAPLWARVCVPCAGNEFGAFFIPDVDSEVLVVFVGDDPTYPIVVGSLWNGTTSIPERVSGSRVDRWTITGKNGTRIAIVEESNGQEKIEIETPAGVRAVLTDASSGSITFTTAESTVTLDSEGVAVDTSGTVSVNASQAEITAGIVNVDAGFSKFSGTVECDTLIATSVVGSSYTPGMGNVW